jgi:DNA uptake protein ComE-like DNA-binding protein
MARRHWLDPLARRLLVVTGHLPGPADRTRHQEAEEAAALAAAVERDFQALKGSQAGFQLDVNRATASDWRRLPGCTHEQADLLVRLQAGGVQISGPDELQQLLQLDAHTLETWRPRLLFHWYGEPAPLPPAPVAINLAGAAELSTRLTLTPERLKGLQRERAKEPFRDLADLQQRLQLPATVVESWIGRVSFETPDPQPLPPTEPPRPGPSLPPTRPSRSSRPVRRTRP